jgi:predicted aminopeptidase
MNWAGGDPLLNTFIGYPEGELARLIFHELAHQVVYAKDDTMFNESFATAVERLGSQRWLDSEAATATARPARTTPVRRAAPAVPRAGAGHAARAGRYLWEGAGDRRRKSRAGGS